MKKLSFILAVILCLLVSLPVLAQDTITATSDSQPLVVDTNPTQAVYMGNLVHDGYTGPLYCANKEQSKTQWAYYAQFPRASHPNDLQVLDLISKAQIQSIGQFTNTDFVTKTVSIDLQGYVDTVLPDSRLIQGEIQKSQSQSLLPMQSMTMTVTGEKTDTASLSLVQGQQSFLVYSTADSQATARSSGNVDIKISTTAGAEVCVFYGYTSASIGDFVWFDTNGDGLQNLGEPGIPGVQVELTGTFTRTTVTDGVGLYLFNNLPPDNYTVKFLSPPGFDLTKSLTGGNSELDSNGLESSISLSAGQRNLSIDLGLIGNGQIGDFVWRDINLNGLQDAPEPGMPNVPVKLYSYPSCESATGTLIANTLTSGNGKYLFSGLVLPGFYRVEFQLPQGGWNFTASNQGDDSLDSDAYPSNGMSDCIHLDISLPVNLDLDAGINQRSDVYLSSKTVEPTTAHQGQTVAYRISFGNNGPGTAYQAQITDLLPDNLTPLNLSSSCQWDGIQEAVLCSLGDLAPGAKGEVTITARVETSQTLLLVNDAFIASLPDKDAGNNDAHAQLLVNPIAISAGAQVYLPFICTPQEPQGPCDILLKGNLVIETRNQVFRFPLSHDTTWLTLPDGQDLPFNSKTQFRLEFPNLDESQVDFTWIQYSPFYVHKQAMGMNEFVFKGGYPSQLLRLHVKISLTLADGTICQIGLKFLESIDP